MPLFLYGGGGGRGGVMVRFMSLLGAKFIPLGIPPHDLIYMHMFVVQLCVCQICHVMYKGLVINYGEGGAKMGKSQARNCLRPPPLKTG